MVATALATAAADEHNLRRRLLAGDEDAFAALVDRYGASLLRFAMAHVRNRAVAEEVVQETWLGVLKGIERFEGRASLKTWIFRILANKAKTRAEREGRTIPFSAFADSFDDGPSVEAERFLPADDPRWPGHWAAAPSSWSEIPEDHLLTREALARLRSAIDELPAMQRRVIILRDVEGWTAEEVCTLLELTEGNQRVLLHRARSKVRTALERYFEEPSRSDGA